MIWLSWRQFRTQAAVIFAAVAALSVALAITGPGLLEKSRAVETFVAVVNKDSTVRTLYIVGAAALYFVPGIIGAFWGAPLVARELETGTFRLAWTQSVSRNRWLATKLALTGLAAAAFAGGLSLAVSWWSDPIDQAAEHTDITQFFGLPRMLTLIFGVRGVAPIGYTVFALAVGVTLGLVLRRTLPALALTLVVVAAVQIAMPVAVREHLISPVTTTSGLTEANVIGMSVEGATTSNPADAEGRELEVRPNLPGSWVISDRTVDAGGRAVGALPAWTDDCPPPLPNAGPGADDRRRACLARVADLGYRQQVVYQPASRFWPLQLAETGLLLALAALLFGFSFWKLRRA